MMPIAKNVKVDMVPDNYGITVYYNSVPVFHIDREDGTLVALDMSYPEWKTLSDKGICLSDCKLRINETINIMGV